MVVQVKIIIFFTTGELHLEIVKNVASSRHNSVGTAEPSYDFEQPLKPHATRRFDLPLSGCLFY